MKARKTPPTKVTNRDRLVWFCLAFAQPRGGSTLFDISVFSTIFTPMMNVNTYQLSLLARYISETGAHAPYRAMAGKLGPKPALALMELIQLQTKHKPVQYPASLCS